MRTLKFVCSIFLTLAILALGVALAYGQPYQKPVGRYGLLTIPAAAATEVPMTISSRRGILIQNLGPTDIYCGFDNAVSHLNGIRVASNGGTYSVGAGFDGNTVRIWCYCTVLQIAPANTRWSEIK